MVQTGWTQEDPTDAVDEFAVGRAWWCRGVGGGGGAAADSGARLRMDCTQAKIRRRPMNI